MINKATSSQKKRHPAMTVVLYVWMRARRSLLSIWKYILETYERIESALAFRPPDVGYLDLAPVDDLEDNSTYLEALDWALSNERILNIALTGPYGSGKSSVLRSYKKERPHYRYLDLSLANFESSGNPPNGDLSCEEVERRILQQLFYKVKAEKLPFGRFRKITHITVWSILSKLSPVFLLIASGFWLFRPRQWMNFVETIIEGIVLLQSSYSNFLIAIAFLVFVAILVMVTVTSVRFFYGAFRMSRFSIKSSSGVEITEDENFTFNKHLDEIVHFFEVNPYEVVFIEDLDRFDDTRVFMKLRELNILLNSSEQINRRVVFIYAIKDDLFKDRDRTKFFDYMIPVIPVVCSSNSGEVMWQQLLKNQLHGDLSEEFVKDVCLYIDEMRLLNNILNEYTVYRSRLKVSEQEHLNSENLFALVVYKNRYPNDFAELQFGRGRAHRAFEVKQELIAERIKELKKQILEFEQDMQNIAEEVLESEKELKCVYWNELIGYSSAVTGVYWNTKRLTLGDVLDGAVNIFEITGKLTKIVEGSYQRGEIVVNEEKRQIYVERCRLIAIKADRRQNEIAYEIEALRNKINQARSWTLTQAIKEIGIDKFLPDRSEEDNLLAFLLRHGHLNEMYENYINYFYEGSLTYSDLRFLMSVKDQVTLKDYSYKLTHVNKLVNRLNLGDFDKQEILNVDLLDYLLEHDMDYGQQLRILFAQLSNEEEESFEFVEHYLATGQKDEFFSMLCSSWHNIWAYISNNPSLSEVRQEYYLKQIISHAALDDIIAINKGDLLRRSINDMPDFLQLFLPEENERAEKILIELGIKFTSLYLTDQSNVDLLRFVIDNDCYALNYHMVELVTRFSLGEAYDDTVFKHAHLTTTKRVKPLWSYIETNMVRYIEDVYLKLVDSIHEDESVLVELLNKEIDLATKYSLLSMQTAKIEDVGSIPQDVWDHALVENKVEPTWPNVLAIYRESGHINDSLQQYLNAAENYVQLAEFQVVDVFDGEEEEVQGLFDAIICCEGVTSRSFAELRKSFPKIEPTFECADISYERTKDLIRYQLIGFHVESYNNVREYHNSLLPFFVANNIDDFLEELDEYELENDELLEMISYREISIKNRAKILCGKLDVVQCPNPKYADTIMELVLDSGVEFHLSDKLVMDLLQHASSMRSKVRLVISEQNEDNVLTYLQLLGEPYSSLTQLRKRPKFEKTKENVELIKILDRQDVISSYEIKEEFIQVVAKYA